MELYQLRAFVTVAELRHLTRAAEKLHVSQPALSGQIKALEDSLGTPLFERGPGGMSLTHAGNHLLPIAERVLASVVELRRAAEALRGEVSGNIKLGTVLEPSYLRVGELLAKLVERHPLVDVDLHQRFSGESLEQVRDGTLDAGFYFGEPPTSPLEGRRLRPMSYRVIVPLEWADKLKNATWAEIAAMPWVFTPQKSSHRQLMNRMFAEHGLEAHKAVEADQEAVIADLVASGVGLSLAREEVALAGHKNGRWLLWDRASLQSALWFVYRTDRAKDPLIVAMLDALADVWPVAAEPSTAGVAKPAAGKATVASR
jgi:DNA-binding transcriptional LysR family regulator